MFNEKTVIPSIRQLKYLDDALKSQSPFILLSDVHIGNLGQLTKRCHEHNKKVLVHIDLVEGLTKDAKGVKWLKDLFKVDGVISPNQRVLQQARKIGLIAIYRIFLLDSRSFEQSLSALNGSQFDAVEVLPGPFATQYIKRIREVLPHKPLLAGGFIDQKEQLDSVFAAGFLAVTTSQPSLWLY
ncbi:MULTISPECIES: glycerol-3-phosphate responsive antiterminator [Cytobacillus]|uniref:Glycerol uptake operon antiterminator regulatory protein n=1 Tax=Cytobacillus stercorigallinarum TaxID=2762240 RepID=A0ABR8QPR4_9BACI|nr:glycerol-3-phosphate responsive antiterminator [Cytobacillus stercorigallinarum]MBD7937282.1 glycerol-3-phosphate responsive antiterminator [Cytobacillus stercorigallinarum]